MNAPFHDNCATADQHASHDENIIMTPTEVLEEFFSKKQVTLQVTISLDSLPGWGFYGEDYLKLVQDLLNGSIGHYNPVVTMIKNGRSATDVMEICMNCGGHIFETSSLLSAMEGHTIYSHFEDNKCDDPAVK